MKKILNIFFIFSILSTGCSPDDDLQEIVNTQIDGDLIGIWKLDYDGDSNDDFFRSFSSNGQWGYWRENYSVDGNGEFTIFNFTADEETGDWWVEENILFLDYDDSPTDDILQYSVSGNTLYLNTYSWSKQ